MLNEDENENGPIEQEDEYEEEKSKWICLFLY